MARLGELGVTHVVVDARHMPEAAPMARVAVEEVHRQVVKAIPHLAVFAGVRLPVNVDEEVGVTGVKPLHEPRDLAQPVVRGDDVRESHL